MKFVVATIDRLIVIGRVHKLAAVFNWILAGYISWGAAFSSDRVTIYNAERGYCKHARG